MFSPQNSEAYPVVQFVKLKVNPKLKLKLDKFWCEYLCISMDLLCPTSSYLILLCSELLSIIIVALCRSQRHMSEETHTNPYRLQCTWKHTHYLVIILSCTSSMETRINFPHFSWISEVLITVYCNTKANVTQLCLSCVTMGRNSRHLEFLH